MSGTLRAIAILLLCLAFDSSSSAQQARPGNGGNGNQRPHSASGPRTSRLSCGNILGFYVLLDREGFSPGEISATAGANLRRAVTAFQTERQLPVTGRPDCEIWRRLEADSPEPTVATYELTPDDVKGPFTERIPPELDEQHNLPALEYRSPMERLAERFHAAPALLRGMNPTARFEPGNTIKVPAVTAFDATTRPKQDPGAADVAVTVSHDESALRATRADGTLVFFAPVSSGSLHDPLPEGKWAITEIAWRPVFHYNPNLFWDADPNDTAVTIKPGPNNPVGVVWIGINYEHYGLHGSPEPSRVGATQSHGCVRLTNWDAARLASLVKRGTPVTFR